MMLASSSYLTFFFLPETVDVNVLHPERNREVQVFEFTDVNRDGVLHNGFEIVVYGDLRDVNNNTYHAFLHGRSEILVEMPSMNHAFLHEFDFLTQRMKDAGSHCGRTQEAHDVARNKILQDGSRLTKRLLLRFPTDIQLSMKPYSPEESNEIEIEIVPFKSDFELAGKFWATTVARVSWKVSVIEIEKRIVKASKDTNRAAEKLSEKLSSMSV
jgi:hypothetical protein